MRHTRSFRDRRDVRNKNVINALKANPCMDCNGVFPPECMDFDHKPGNVKLFDISKATCTVVKLLAEVEKCELVCANCHRIRTKNRKGEQTWLH